MTDPEIKDNQNLPPNLDEIIQAKVTEATRDKDEKIAELGGKMETLQDSLDSALEEMALAGRSPEAEDEEEPETPPEGAPKPKVEGELTEKDLEKEIEESIKADDEVRGEQAQMIEEILLKQEVRDLQDEMKEAIAKYPNANEGEILLAVEDGSEESVENLAKTSAERRTKELDDFKSKVEVDVKERLSKEYEGKINVPQSPGSNPPAPTPPMNDTPSKFHEDSAWGEALKKAKVEGGGA